MLVLLTSKDMSNRTVLRRADIVLAVGVTRLARGFTHSPTPNRLLDVGGF